MGRPDLEKSPTSPSHSPTSFKPLKSERGRVKKKKIGSFVLRAKGQGHVVSWL